jgi:aspartate/methionine/tyrosine aminotransferase
MSLSERLAQTSTGSPSKLSKYWAALKDETVITLGGGDPDFDTPGHISQAAVEAIKRGETHYSPSQGILSLREAVAARYLRKYAVTISPDEIQITSGAANALFLAIHSFILPGDRVVILQPAMGYIINQVEMAGGVVVPFWLENQEPLLDRKDELKALLNGARMLISTSPNNPTGRVLTNEEVELLVSMTSEEGCYMLSDEVYDEVIFDGTQVTTALSFNERDHIIVVNSFSKTYAMTGWRLGYLIASEPLREVATRCFGLSVSHINTPTQHAGIAALNSDQEAVVEMVREYEKRRNALVAELRKIPGIVCWPPNAGLFCFVDISETGLDPAEIAERMLEEVRVFVIPGTGYGIHGNRFIRLTFANASVPVLEEAGERMARFFASLG